MIKQIKSSEVKKLLEENPKTVILDVRTNDELNSVGKINAEDLGSKFGTYFLENVVVKIKQF